MLAIKHNGGLEEIESLRRELVNDQSPVEGQDFGAGSRVVHAINKKTIGRIARHGISSKKDCIFFYEIIKMIQPKTCIELGTSLGIATAYLSKSSVKGQVYSFEGNEDLVAFSTEVLNKLDCKNVQIIHGDIDRKLPEFLSEMHKIDFALIDANHTEKALLTYFDMLRQKIIPGGIIVIDDIRWSRDMYRAWEKAYADMHVSISIEFLNKGLLIFDLGICKQHYVLSY